jgi:hypothetical protein
MPAEIHHNDDGTITVSATFMPGNSMLESERNVQCAVNEVGCAATGECLRRFDTDGGKLEVAGRKLTSCGMRPKDYQTPYGVARIKRHVYQGSKGGATYCPLEYSARIMRTATPLFAMQTAFKYANSDATTVVRDFGLHGRKITRSYALEVAADVASVVDEKDSWVYTLPAAPAGGRVRTVGIGVDGTCTHFTDGAWKQVMVGTITFYDEDDERIDSIYVAAAPEAGKREFFGRMEKELARVRAAHPRARYAGIADGAHDLWEWLEDRGGGACSWSVVDFWHASEYIAACAAGMCRAESGRAAWIEDACHRLKHDAGAVDDLLGEFEAARAGRRDGSPAAEALDRAISYFGNHRGRMKYSVYRAMGLPIGSGVTEAACKTIAKARLCGSGMRWTHRGVEEVLSLRTLVKSGDRWEQFWVKATRFGFTKINKPKRKQKV